MSKATCTVEFIGGPFDGHRARFASAKELPEDLAWLVSENVFRLLYGQERAPKGQITSVAVYHRGRRGNDWCYRFTSAMSPREVGNCWTSGNTWLGKLVRSLFDD
ncbi:MAG TPA: hypothetical protein VFB96_22770 [Pirellulaceae bacterium]|nr:hypothetical protein [Pirellulaceae bacterium]